MTTARFLTMTGLWTALVGVGCFTYVKMYGDRDRRPTDDDEENMCYLYSGVLLGGMLLWPVLFDLCIGLRDLVKRPRMMFGFFWVPLIMALDMGFVVRGSTQGELPFQHHELSQDTSTIISAAFAMGSLFYASARNYSATHILMYALLLCIAFIVPTVTVPRGTKQAVLVRSVQKVALNYAIGLVICGISVDLFHGVFPSDQVAQPIEKK